MTYLVRHVSIAGFQGNRNVEIPLWDDVNFIIGRNGTGKTSFIRLLHACLSLDFEEIVQVSFSTTIIKFRDTETNYTPELKVQRSGTASNYIDISFRPSGKGPFRKYYIDDDDTPSSRTRLVVERNIIAALNKKRDSSDSIRPLAELRRLFKRNIQFSWLPLLRSRSFNKRNELYYSEANEDPINRKLRELIGHITSYIAILDTRVSEENKKFQRNVFVSYIQQGLFDIPALKDLDLSAERTQLLKMLQEMDYPISELLVPLDHFITAARQTQDTVIPGQSTLNVGDVVNIVTANALHRIVRSFGGYTAAKEDILFPEEQFLRLINSLLYKKEAFFDEGNVLKVRTVTGDEEIGPTLEKMGIFDLSSGEKQLLVILSETLLQQGRRYVFIADEPELSLHVEWQERLVKTLRELNKNAQIIFATHSPDIVSVYQDKVIDFETI